jgi:type IV secretion system protein TrbJ
MKSTLTKRRKWIVAGALILGAATPSFALFGLPSIVFDPTNYGELASQLSTMFKMLTTAQNEYNTVKSNVQSFSVKTIWQTELNKIKNVSVPNTYGETNGMTNALNFNSQSAALMAWTNSKIGLGPETSGILSTQTVGNSSNLTQLAMIEASDTASPDCLNAVGSYRQARTDSATAEANLQSAQLDGSSSTNSEVEQLNLLNAAQAQQLNEQQAQGVLHACLAQQMTIQNMQQRNAAAEDLNTWGFVQVQHTANPTLNVSDTGTWTTYLP